jgi:hypothetical protein
MTEQTHYFASSDSHHVRGLTRAGALAKLARDTGTGTLKQFSGPGMPVWTCRVLAPFEAEYGVRDYAPYGVEVEKAQSFNLHTVKGYVTPVDNAYDDE